MGVLIFRYSDWEVNVEGMNYVFSARELAFYTVDMIDVYKKGGVNLESAIAVSDDTRNRYNGSPPAGLRLGVDSEGMPAWVALDPAEIATRNAQTRSVLRAKADDQIAWRQDAVDAEIATDAEVTELAAWKKYRVLLMRVDTAAPIWPIQPEV